MEEERDEWREIEKKTEEEREGKKGKISEVLKDEGRKEEIKREKKE